MSARAEKLDRRHCGSTGDVRNCQVMVVLTYAAEGGYTFCNRRLYLPAVWTRDVGRCRDAGVPEEITFATKPGLGIAMLRGAIARNLPFAWVAADADYGKDPALRAGVPATLPVAGPPGKPHQPSVAKAGDLLHYAVVRDKWSAAARERTPKGSATTTVRGSRWSCPASSPPTASPITCSSAAPPKRSKSRAGAFLTVQRAQHTDPERAHVPEDEAAFVTAPEQGGEQGKDTQTQEMSACR
ncbi:transposase [Streptomyces sp. NPDC004376]